MMLSHIDVENRFCQEPVVNDGCKDHMKLELSSRRQETPAVDAKYIDARSISKVGGHM